jgi:thiol-disulfide isomerase/thioredoxin
MNKIYLLLISFFFNFSLFAADGYHLKIKVLNNKSSMAYLAFYYAKQGNILKKDSSVFDEKTKLFKFDSEKKIVGGIYVMVFKDQTGNIEFLLDNGDEFEVKFDKEDIIPSARFVGSDVNKQFYEYQNFVEELAPKYQLIESNLAKCITKSDTMAQQQKIVALSKSIIDFRSNYIKKYPVGLASKIFSSMLEPELPTTYPKKADGTIDSNYKYKFIKQHYWDNFVWNDDRMINIPVYDKKLEEYFRYVVPTPDSFNKEVNMILEKHKDAREMYKYSLWWLTRYAENSKVMGMDESFVYIVEQYYMKGKAFWLSEENVGKYIKRAREISPSALGNPAPNLKVPDIDGNVMSFGDEYEKHDYTLIAFWSSDCGHCKREIPAIDSIISSLKKRFDVGIIGFHTEDVGEKWRSFIRDNRMNPDNWRHVHDPTGQSNYFSKFDVRSTPDCYMVDRNGLIVGKHVDDKSIEALLQILENKKKGKTE